MFSLKKLLIFLFVFISSATLYPQEFIQGEIVDHYGSFYTVAYSRVIKKKNMVHEIAQLKNSFDEVIISIRTELNPDGTCKSRDEKRYVFGEAVEEDFLFGLAFAPITIPMQLAMIPIRYFQSKPFLFPSPFAFDETKKNVFAKIVVSLGLAELLESYI
jgi:hypothetical protein